VAFTEHGHQIKGTPVSGIQPKQVSRCGGPGFCPACSKQAAGVLRQINKPKIPLTYYRGGERFVIGTAELEPDGTISAVLDDPGAAEALFGNMSTGFSLGREEDSGQTGRDTDIRSA
jgi:hypothetical protein